MNTQLLVNLCRGRMRCSWFLMSRQRRETESFITQTKHTDKCKRHHKFLVEIYYGRSCGFRTFLVGTVGVWDVVTIYPDLWTGWQVNWVSQLLVVILEVTLVYASLVDKGGAVEFRVRLLDTTHTDIGYATTKGWPPHHSNQSVVWNIQISNSTWRKYTATKHNNTNTSKGDEMQWCVAGIWRN